MRKSPTSQVVTRVVRWAILIFFIYALFTGSFHFTGQKPPPAPPDSGAPSQLASKDCSSLSGLDDFSILAPAFLPARLPMIHTEDIKPGTGENGAVCGQHAVFEFEYALEDATVIYKSSGTPHEIIGEGKLLRGMEIGMLGMKPDGERRISFPAMLGFAREKNPNALLGAPFSYPLDKLKQSVVVGTLTLRALSPSLPSTSQPLRVIDHKFGGGAKAQCGDTIDAELTLWKLDGTKLFSTRDAGKPLTFTLGASMVPFGIEQSAIDMTENGSRTVILPAAYVKPLVTQEDAKDGGPLMQLPEETLLAEIRVLHINAVP